MHWRSGAAIGAASPRSGPEDRYMGSGTADQLMAEWQERLSFAEEKSKWGKVGRRRHLSGPRSHCAKQRGCGTPLHLAAAAADFCGCRNRPSFGQRVVGMRQSRSRQQKVWRDQKGSLSSPVEQIRKSPRYKRGGLVAIGLKLTVGPPCLAYGRDHPNRGISLDTATVIRHETSVISSTSSSSSGA